MNESAIYASKIMSEVLTEGFVIDEKKSISTLQVFRNDKRQLMLTLIDQSNSGYIVVTIGKPGVKPQNEMKPKVSEPKESVFDPSKSKQPQAKFIPPVQTDSTNNKTFITDYSTLKNIYTPAELIKTYGCIFLRMLTTHSDHIDHSFR